MTIKVLRHVALFCAAWFIVSSLMSGCHCVVYHQDVHRPRPIYVSSPPPPQKQEAKTAQPSVKHFWVAGSWDWNTADDEWEWEKGSWAVPPEDSSKWKKPSYEDRGDGDWVFTPGYWVDETASREESTISEGVGIEQSGAVEKPADATKKPGGVLARPAEKSEKPGIVSTPGGVVEKPAEEAKKPGGVVARPADKAKKPGGVVARPADKAKKPGGVVARPAGKIKKPGGVVARPAGKIKKPGGVIPRPADKAKKPGGVIPRPADKAKKLEDSKSKKPEQAIDNTKKKPGPAKKPNKKIGVKPRRKKVCKKSGSCNCNKKCDTGEKKNNCADCK